MPAWFIPKVHKNSNQLWISSTPSFGGHDNIQRMWIWQEMRWEKVQMQHRSCKNAFRIYREGPNFHTPHRYDLNSMKQLNNLFYYFSCGFYIDYEEYNYPWDLDKPNHNLSVTRTHAHYLVLGDGVYKTILTSQSWYPNDHTYLKWLAQNCWTLH